jgi:hypothetical protein
MITPKINGETKFKFCTEPAIPTKIPLHFFPFPPESTGTIPNKQVLPCVSFEVFMAVIIQTVIFLVVTPCSLVGGYQYRVPQIMVFVLSIDFNCPCYFSLPLPWIIRNSMYYQL